MERKAYEKMILLYRMLYKQAKYNKTILREIFSKEASERTEIIDNLTKKKIDNKNTFLLQLSDDFLRMKKNIVFENNLLYSYNINVNRNNKDQIQKTANYVGLKV